MHACYLIESQQVIPKQKSTKLSKIIWGGENETLGRRGWRWL